jgi:hypothetical protein
MIELLTSLLVLITAFYAWVTYRILKANERVVETMREQSEATYRPYVTVTLRLEPDNPIFYLRIANLGKTAAKDLRLSLDRSFFKFGERSEAKDLASFAVFNQSIDSLPPESEIVFSLAQGFVVFADGADPDTCPIAFTITATYSFSEKQVEEHHVIDLRPYFGADVPQDPIIRKLKSINDTLVKLTEAVKSAP